MMTTQPTNVIELFPLAKELPPDIVKIISELPVSDYIKLAVEIRLLAA
jgi:hypothetical protein